MFYQYSEDQNAFRDSLRRFVQDHYDYETRRQRLEKSEVFNADYWRQLAELGVLGLPFSETDGGLDLDFPYLMAVAEEIGRGLVLEPVLPVTVAGRLLAASNSSDAKSHLAALISGECLVSLAWEESSSRGNPLLTQCTLVTRGDGYVLNGKKQAALAAAESQFYIVSARDSGGDLQLLLLNAKHSGITQRCYLLADGNSAADLEFNNVELPASAIIASASQAEALLQTAISESIVVMAAEAIGAIDQLLVITQEYLLTRKQFGMPLAMFQSLQHRFADMVIAAEKLRSLLWAACQQLGSDNQEKAAAQLKVQLGESARYVGQQAVQLHGGIGMTDELNVGAYFKRLTVMELLCGQQDYHLGKLAELALVS
ncbi:acyl-CoA dehydrogenase family protein [Zhongshania marina]|uniref:Acyl-CoA dehydrogenase n=1 Tax=Zhongshania marina TaxID=2304603 RepID=A0A2S4HFJ3_9GAMM|nr:acyl-CoA dehydrogenase [Marortus luteolus]POP52762.1 acyl-CoA dehydrogenase [Marortus luteolus]